MRYVGGKGRVAERLADALREATSASTIYEPFLGGGAMLGRLARRFDRVETADAHEDIALLWSAVAEGWRPPLIVTEPEYATLRAATPSPLRGFVGAGGSFGGKWFGGYARGGRNADGSPRNHQAESARAVQRIAEMLDENVCVIHRDYRETPIVPGTAIYCDPPYAGTLGYGAAFDHDEFWEWSTAAAAAGVDVFVSEYSAPSGWQEIWAAEVRQSVTRPSQGRGVRIERLFARGHD